MKRTLGEVMDDVSILMASTPGLTAALYEELSEHIGALIDAKAQRSVTVESGYITLETGTPAKDGYTVKIHLPIAPDPGGTLTGVEAERVRLMAQTQFDLAVTWAKEKYGRAS